MDDAAKRGADSRYYETMRIVLALVALAGCGPSSTACNGHDALCTRPYDAVTFPGTHDAYSNRAENFGAPDQSYTMTRQLHDGVRVLHLEIYPFEGDAYLCHHVCQIGSKLLADGLAEVRAFLDDNPREVVTLLMESSGVTSDAIAAALDTAKLVSSLRVQAMGAPWPTLAQLIDRGERVVALLADLSGTGGTSYPWLLDRFAWSWETPWDNTVPADFTRCDADRGQATNDLYVVDTYLEDQILPTPQHAVLVNTNPFLLERLLHCKAASGKLPSFAMVNYYEVGDLFADVDVLNGLAPAPGYDLDAFPASWLDGGAPDAAPDAPAPVDGAGD
jgi:hypothetical protein